MQYVVYGLSDKSGNIRYVGMTKNHVQRHKQHAANISNNIRLAKFIKEHGVNMSFLHVCETYENMRRIEVEEIQTRENLLNIVHKEFTPQSVSKPWMAGTGVRCPSSIGMYKLSMSGKNMTGLKKWIKSLTDEERCWYEINVAKDLWKMEGFRPSILKWLKNVCDNMEEFLPVLKKGCLYVEQK